MTAAVMAHVVGLAGKDGEVLKRVVGVVPVVVVDDVSAFKWEQSANGLPGDLPAVAPRAIGGLLLDVRGVAPLRAEVAARETGSAAFPAVCGAAVVADERGTRAVDGGDADGLEALVDGHVADAGAGGDVAQRQMFDGEQAGHVVRGHAVIIPCVNRAA